jgi:hypothetical protein
MRRLSRAQIEFLNQLQPDVAQAVLEDYMLKPEDEADSEERT